MCMGTFWGSCLKIAPGSVALDGALHCGSALWRTDGGPGVGKWRPRPRTGLWEPSPLVSAAPFPNVWSGQSGWFLRPSRAWKIVQLPDFRLQGLLSAHWCSSPGQDCLQEGGRREEVEGGKGALERALMWAASSSQGLSSEDKAWAPEWRGAALFSAVSFWVWEVSQHLGP